MTDKSNNPTSKLFLVMVMLAVAASLSFQGSRGLYETTEGRYAECAREMIETGNYLEPTLNYRPHWSKPPLTYWAIAGGIKLAGQSEWGVRLYNVAAFTITVLAVAAMGAALWGQKEGIIAGLIYASSPFPVFGAFAVSTDTLLAMWEILAVLCYVKARTARNGSAGKAWIAAMWLSFGSAFLTKGPPALLPLIPVAIWHFHSKPPVRIVNAAGIMLFLFSGVLWYTVACSLHPGLWSYYLGTEIVDRIASSSVHNHQWYKPLTIYLPVLTIGAGPWLYHGIKLVRQKELYRPSMLVGRVREGGANAFLIMWFFLPLAVFCLVKSRLELYVLPLYAPIALAVARGICVQNRKNLLKHVVVVSTCTVILLVMLKGVVSFVSNPNDMRPISLACRKIGGDRAEFATFYEPKLYGLQYYLDGKLKRLSFHGKEDWADDGLFEIIEKTRNTAKRPARYILVADKDKAPLLVKTLEKARVRFERFDQGKRWRIFALGEDSGSSKKLYQPISF